VNIFGIGLGNGCDHGCGSFNFWPKSCREGRSIHAALKLLGSLRPSLSEADQLEPVKTTAQIEPKQIEAADSENHAATPSNERYKGKSLRASRRGLMTEAAKSPIVIPQLVVGRNQLV